MNILLLPNKAKCTNCSTALKNQPGNPQSISHRALPTTAAPFLLGQPGDPGGIQDGSRRDDLMEAQWGFQVLPPAPRDKGLALCILPKHCRTIPLSPLACEARGKRGSLPSGNYSLGLNTILSSFQVFLVPERQQMPDGLRKVKWGAQQDNI